MSFYDAVVPAYLQMLNSLSGLLTKAEAHCAAKKIEPGVLIGSRLFPDMLATRKADPARQRLRGQGLRTADA